MPKCILFNIRIKTFHIVLRVHWYLYIYIIVPTIHERALFYQRSQQPGESVEAFVRSLHELAAHCRFEEKESEHVRDRLISGMLDKDMSLKLQL